MPPIRPIVSQHIFRLQSDQIAIICAFGSSEGKGRVGRRLSFLDASFELLVFWKFRVLRTFGNRSGFPQKSDTQPSFFLTHSLRWGRAHSNLVAPQKLNRPQSLFPPCETFSYLRLSMGGSACILLNSSTRRHS